MSALELLVLSAGVLVPTGVVAGLVAAAGTLPPAPVDSTALGVVVAAGLATLLALGATPAGGLLVAPVLPVPVSCLAFAVAVRVHGGPSTRTALAWIPLALAVGVLAVLVRGMAVDGPVFVGQVLRPPSLVGSGVALSATTLGFYPLGRTIATRSDALVPLAVVVVALPGGTLLAAALRPFTLVSLLAPGASALVAVLLGVPLFRLGHAVAARDPGPSPLDGPH